MGEPNENGDETTAVAAPPTFFDQYPLDDALIQRVRSDSNLYHAIVTGLLIRNDQKMDQLIAAQKAGNEATMKLAEALVGLASRLPRVEKEETATRR